MVYDAGILGTLHGGMISILIAIGIGFAMSDLNYTNFTNGDEFHEFDFAFIRIRIAGRANAEFFNATY